MISNHSNIGQFFHSRGFRSSTFQGVVCKGPRSSIKENPLKGLDYGSGLGLFGKRF